jgi:hypothetical protein
MKVGVITFHFNYNYGAVLQCYATCMALRSLGHEPEVINYVPPYFRPDADHHRGLGLRNGKFIAAATRRLLEMRRRIRFNLFRKKYLPLTGRLSQVELRRHALQYDTIVVGSDQVWNLHWMDHFDGFYFGDFVAPSQRLISYASCFGRKDQPEDRLINAGSLLQRFDAVSVRNDSSRELATKATGSVPAKMADPTLLHDFVELLPAPPTGGRRDIVIYVLAESELSTARRLAEAEQRRRGGRIVFIGNNHVRSVPWANLNRTAMDPVEWLRAIKSAEFFITDSFHGAIFAAKFATPALIYTNGWRAARLTDLCASLHIPAHPDSTEDMRYWQLDEVYFQTTASAPARLLAEASRRWLHQAVEGKLKAIP